MKDLPHELSAGQIIRYRLPLSRLPKDPKRLWTGRIVAIAPQVVLVELLEPGYEGEQEYIPVECIVSFSQM